MRWKVLPPLVVVALLVAACNQITGESSLDFDGGDDGGTCGSLAYSGACQTCLQTSCCSQAQACSGDAGCSAFSQCLTACSAGDQGCYLGCVKGNQCGVNLYLQLSTCLGASCAAECPTTVGSAPDASACQPVEYGPCNQNAQCGCTKGQNCVVSDVAGDTSCVTAGSALDNQPCTSNTQCAVGFTCYGGACMPFCATDASCTKFGAGSRCYAGYNYVDACSEDVNVPGMGVCSSGCDPLEPKALCGPGLTCYAQGDTSYCTGPTGTGVGAGGCAGSSLCAVGYDCVTYTSSYGSGSSALLQRTTCEAYCRIGMTDCPSTQTCTALNNPPTIDGVEYGVCMPNCSPVTSAGCPTGTSCVVSVPQGAPAFTDCLQTGTGIGSNGCATTGFNCAPGYYCASGNCNKYCETNSDCTGGGTCTAFDNPLTVRGVAYGFCD
jgi:hypothetical protein